MSTPRRRFGVRILKLGAALVVAALGVELAGMATLPRPPVDRAPLVKVETHPVLGYRLAPNQRTFSYQAPVETNAEGLRERPRTVTSSAARRVLFVGGSETFGKGVSVEDTFARRVEAHLGPDTRTINAGTPDWNLEQSLRFVETEAVGYEPSAVVVVFYWDDLFFDASTTTSSPAATETSSAAPAQRGEWFLRRWARESGLLARLAPLYTRSRALYAARNLAKEAWGRVRGQVSLRWRDALLEGASRDDLDEAWAAASAGFARLAIWSLAHDVPARLLILPMEASWGRDEPSRGFQREARRRAEAEGLTVIDATAALEGAPAEEIFIPYDGRPSAEGHRRIADATQAGLRELYQQMP